MIDKKSVYITTTLPYVNSDPHLGFALEITQADTVARFKRQEGFDVFFNFGTDEHGLKIYQKALEQGKETQTYVDEYAEKFAEKAIIKNTSVFARIGLKIDGIFPGLGLACLVLLTLILFAVGVFVLEQVMPKVGISDQIATGTSVLIMFLGSLGIVALLFHLDPDTKKNKYKKKGAVEYYKTHPVDGVIMQFVKSNSKTTEP